MLNAHSLGHIENGLRALFFLAPGRFRDSEVLAELAYAVLGCLSLTNDIIVLRYLRRQTSQPFNLYNYVQVLMSVTKSTELFIEVFAKHKWSTRGKWTGVFLVELFKAVFRIVLLIRYKKVLCHQTLPDRTEMLNEQNAHLFTKEAIERISINTPVKREPKSTVENLDKSVIECDMPLANHFLSEPAVKERHKPRQTLLRRHVASRSATVPQPYSTTLKATLNESEESCVHSADQQTNVAVSHFSSLSPTLLAGEVLYIIRPLLYLLAMFLFGSRSWKPWLLSLIVDATSYYCSTRTLLTLSGDDQTELARRVWQWPFYLLRSPFFEFVQTNSLSTFLWKLFAFLPGVQTLSGFVRAYLETYREFYFYISGS